MKKRALSIILSCLMLASVLAGCGSSAQESSAAEPSSVQEESSSSLETGNEKPYDGVQLNFLRHSGYDADWMAEKTKDFYEQTGIQVNVEQVAYSDSHNKFVVDASSAGGTYDLYATTEYWLPEFYEGGWIVDIKPYLENSDLYEESYDIGDVSQAMLDLNSIDGKLLAMPWKFNSQMLCYRSDLIAAAPASWDDVLAAAKAQSETGTTGIALALSKASAMDIYLNLLYQNGGTFLSDDLKTCNLDTAQAKEAMEFLVELAKYTSDGAVNSQWPETATLISQGSAAMAYMVNTQAGNILDSEKSDVTDKIAFAEQPGPVTPCGTSSTWGICITQNCENPEAAFLFIQYITGASNMKELVEQTNGSTNPVRSSLLADTSLNEAYPWFSVMNDIATKEGHTFAYPKTTQCTSIMEILAGHVQNAVIGAESVDDALSKAKTEIENLL